METPLHSSEQLREDLRYLRGALERQQQLHRRLLPLPGAIILSLYILSLCARRDLAPAWHSPLFDLAGYAVLVALAVYPWLDARRHDEVVRCAPADAVRILLPWADLGFAMILLFQIVDRFAIPAEAVSALLILSCESDHLRGRAERISNPVWDRPCDGRESRHAAPLAAIRMAPVWRPGLLGLIGGALVERRAENK
jgi:hypothetical protein